MIIAIWLITAIPLGIATGIATRNPVGGMLVSFFLTPLLVLVLIYMAIKYCVVGSSNVK